MRFLVRPRRLCGRSTFGVSRESQGLKTCRMLGPCFRQCSSNAQALPQACRRLIVFGWCAGPMASTSGSCAAAAEICGRSPVQCSTAKSIAGLGQGGRQDCRGAQQNDVETLKSILSSSRLVPPFETASYFDVRRGNSDAYGHRRGETRLMSHVSCHRLMSRVTQAIVSSFRQGGAPGRERSRGCPPNHVNRRGRVPRRAAGTTFERGP
jgi:hypothetical protein